MSTTKISIINESTVVSDNEVIAAIADLQTQVSRDFAAAWGIHADLTFVPSGSQPASGSWWLSILDNADQAGALGYHDITNEGRPLGKVFAATDKQFGANWTVTASLLLGSHLLMGSHLNFQVSYDAFCFFRLFRTLRARRLAMADSTVLHSSPRDPEDYLPLLRSRAN
jgi:hypothetical protein